MNLDCLTFNILDMPVFKTTQLVKTDVLTCWNFFSDPSNLARITPPEMGFKIRFPQPVPGMYAGMIIRYTVRPFPAFPVTWITEITHVDRLRYFVDNQVSGPYRLWHHQHIFEEVPGGVMMTDIVNYELPLGWLGAAIAGKQVRQKIGRIFEYRSSVIGKVFP
jgi:ligand-binding SRPBCC domain-containing protein